ncbi:trypsin-like peptidase domain-containing protein [Rhodobacter sp. Har01]|uniref:S1C family serine protease n=1 Tax=Rhodobacter sp. Har01 TaxID=2883999 RepID=UPI001D082249|nr:trypsin-like peptidase domain-containing protein [Rhodobacter sp. Har01]MCB6179595.1 trypsin-like peptidase domain-containing protein [Rhodobacter sp. Har01]
MISKTSIGTAVRKRLFQGLAAVLFALAVLLAALPTVRPAGAGEAPLEAAMDAVLVVRTNDAEDRFLGSAFLWGDEALVAVTNAHVVGAAEEVRLVDRHGQEEVGRVIARDEVRDVAVIAVAPGRRGLVAAEGPAGLGLEVYALGAPLGIEFTLTEGMISAVARQVETQVPLRMLQHDAAVNPGSSGGPVVDAAGRLVGMNSQIADGSRMFVGIAYAIGAEDLTRIVDGLVAETLAPFPKLGMVARPVDRQVAEALGVPAAGLLVDGVEPGGLAAAAGLVAGDIILAVDGVALAEAGEMAFLIEAALARGEAALVVRRGAEEVSLVLAFAAEAEVGGLGIAKREIDLSAQPETIKAYRLSGLGVVLGDDGVVTGVTENSPALFAGLAKGDRILAVNGQAMDLAALKALEITEPVLLLVAAPGGATRHLYLDPWGKGGGLRPVGGANVLDPDVVVF